MTSAKVFMNITGVEDTLKAVQKYQSSINTKVDSLINELVKQGVQIAKFRVQAMPWSVFRNKRTNWYEPTGGLMNSITGVYDPGSRSGLIFADSPYAFYVEYGTGVYSQSSGRGAEGWYYYADGERHWTRGEQARPFMYEAYMELKDLVPSVAKAVFHK